MTEKGGKVITELGIDPKGLKKGLSEAKKETKKHGQDMKKWGIDVKNIAETALGFGVANAAQKATEALKDFTVNSIKDFLSMERAMQSFQLIVGETADGLLKSMGEASKGLVSDFDMVRSANKALLLGIAENDLPELMEVAASRGKVMGITVTQAFDDITVGIGRQSRMILDNLGIILDMDKSYKDFADTLENRTVASLTDLEKKQALTNAIMEQSAGLVEAMNALQETHADKLERLSAGWKDFGVFMGEALVTGIDGVIEFGNAVNILSDQEIISTTNQEAISNLASDLLDASTEAMNLQQQLKGIESALAGLSEISLEGEQESKVEILRTRQRIAELQLAESRGEEAPALQVDEEVLSLDELQKKLKELQLERQIEFNLFKELSVERGKLTIEEQKQIAITKDEFTNTADVMIETWGSVREEIRLLYAEEIPKLREELKLLREESKEEVEVRPGLRSILEPVTTFLNRGEVEHTF